MMVQHVPVMMNAGVFVEAEVVAPIMVIPAIQVHIVADIKAVIMEPVRNTE
jgi:hypothetical protein